MRTSTESLLSVLAECANQRMEEVHLLLSTPGGAVMNGMNIYNVLKGMPFTVVTHNVGNVDSIGNVVYLAGEHRYACPYTTFIFHGVSIGIAEAEIEDERLLRERIVDIESDEERIGGIIAERTKIPKEEATRFFAESHTMNAADAVSRGIVHEIRDVAIPAGSSVVTLVFKR
jgi:ATP-dependent Clp protease, protease subunit